MKSIQVVYRPRTASSVDINLYPLHRKAVFVYYYVKCFYSQFYWPKTGHVTSFFAILHCESQYKFNKLVYYIRLYFTVFLLARSNTCDIPFSNILISKKQFLCNKKAYCTLVQNQ